MDDRVTEAQGIIQEHLTEADELGGDRPSHDHPGLHTFHVSTERELIAVATMISTIATELHEWSSAKVYWTALGQTDGDGVDLYFHVDVVDPKAGP